MSARRPTVRPALAALAALLAALAAAPPAAARNTEIAARRYEVGGGIGFAADMTTWAPGGFKWFNELGIHLRGITWLDFQFNVTAGGGSVRCFYDPALKADRCDDNKRNFGGSAMELGAGVKLKWRVSEAPVQVHAKLGGSASLIWFNRFEGAAIAFRGGAGARYFVVPELGVGAELIVALGPAFMRTAGAAFYGALDLNVGVEWRF